MKKEFRIAHYLIQVAYAREGWEALVKQPQDRIEAVRPAIDRVGGKISSAYFAFGDYDVVLLAELPDNVSAAAIAMAFAGGGEGWPNGISLPHQHCPRGITAPVSIP